MGYKNFTFYAAACLLFSASGVCFAQDRQTTGAARPAAPAIKRQEIKPATIAKPVVLQKPTLQHVAIPKPAQLHATKELPQKTDMPKANLPTTAPKIVTPPVPAAAASGTK